ncbi:MULTISPECIES: ParB/RepB/Spo0J family partition protein [unclassified Streptomyces]|uniref:ParB/RepB/Spo0J family partition protein n=1 Tax=unclassified Streptomyces TaxID=2593676 RepID=UPI00226DDB52|nr:MULTISPECIES: ParB/RepB/Spo0J family partition protein [unclassified Streptomyces]MCY0924113.1 ParB/RepB/Spo0J family partition protein [Streptomyces sp. H27-G5]MCY0963152.1 ParB/RepB/Spo0J family partition protein [Streptomyces sp. H27-H5]
MSKSDLLGTGAAFSNARRSGGRSERGRAKAIAQGDLPAYELLRVPLDQVSASPLNPRRNFGTDEEKTRFGEELRHAQLSACVVASRSAYLGLWPDHESRIGSASYVLINGERRFRSALHVGLETLDFVVRDDLAASRADFIDHLLAENLEREDFNVVERARGVQQLVDTCAENGREHGAKSRAAERLGRSPSWVTNQLVLLELPEEIQSMLSSGDLPERDGRLLARAAKDRPGADAAELLEFLQENKAQEAQVRAAQREILRGVQESAPVREEPAAEIAGGVPDAAQGNQEPARLLSADKSRDAESLPAAASVEPSTAASASAPTRSLAPAPAAEQVWVTPTPPPPAAEAPVQERDAEGVIPPHARGTDTTPVPWQDPKAMFDAIWTNMSAKHRAELTILLIENNKPT